MSIFTIRPRVQEAADPNGGGGGGGVPEFLKGFGEHAKAFGDVKDPAAFAKTWTDTQTELAALKSKAPATFDWRKEIGGDDAEAQKVLARFTDPKMFFKSFDDAQKKIRAGEVAKPLAKDAKPEEVAEYRKANGIPEKPEGYFEKLPEGLVIGEDDKPLFNDFAKAMHDLNAKPETIHAAAKWYYQLQERESAETTAMDKKDSVATTAALKEKWGGDYTPNMKAIGVMLDGLGADLKATFLDATLGDGKRLMNSPEVMQLFAELALLKNPLAHVMPAGGAGDMKSLDSEIAAIEKVMKEDRRKYNADQGMQDRLRKLYDAKGKLASK
jgi:hypothetical protein